MEKSIIFFTLSITSAPYSPSAWHVLIQPICAKDLPHKVALIGQLTQAWAITESPVSSFFFSVFSFQLAAFPLWMSPQEQLLNQILKHSLCWRRNMICHGPNMAIYSFKVWNRVTDNRDWIHAEKLLILPAVTESAVEVKFTHSWAC